MHATSTDRLIGPLEVELKHEYSHPLLASEVPRQDRYFYPLGQTLPSQLCRKVSRQLFRNVLKRLSSILFGFPELSRPSDSLLSITPRFSGAASAQREARPLEPLVGRHGLDCASA